MSESKQRDFYLPLPIVSKRVFSHRDKPWARGVGRRSQGTLLPCGCVVTTCWQQRTPCKYNLRASRSWPTKAQKGQWRMNTPLSMFLQGEGQPEPFYKEEEGIALTEEGSTMQDELSSLLLGCGYWPGPVFHPLFLLSHSFKDCMWRARKQMILDELCP